MASNVFSELSTLYPWIANLGLSNAWIQNAIAESATGVELAARIRSTTQYKRRFQGMYRSDGTQRWTEAEHFARESQVRQLLRQYGVDVETEYATPQSLIGFHESDKSLQEIRDELEIWEHVRTAGDTYRETFYVYAEMNPSDDDLFEALVDPAKGQALFNSYNANRAQLAPDYAGFIKRATAAGRQRAVTELQRLQRQGALSAQAVQRIMAVDPTFAAQMMDQIYKGADPNVSSPLNLQQALSAFEFAVIGAAAQEAGLVLPTRERLEEIRAVGVERDAAARAYREFGRDQSLIAAAVQRARGTNFGQREFEEAEFFGNAAQSRNLQAGITAMEAAGREQGNFRFTEDRGRITQRGFTRGY